MTVPAPFRARRTPYQYSPLTDRENRTHGGISSTGVSANMSNSEKARAAAFIKGDLGRKVVSVMIKKVFPGTSDAAVAALAAPVLGISVRHARRLIKGEHDASSSIVLALICLVGFEAALGLMLRAIVK